MMTSNIVRTAKTIDYYWYRDGLTHDYIIGVRGVGSEVKIPFWEVVRAEDSFRLRNGRAWSYVEAIEWAYRWAYKESEYIDFEEVIETPKLLNG